MNYQLRPCQQAAVDHAVNFLRSNTAGAKQLYSGPTGVGKSVVILETQRQLGREDCFVVTPREEIVAGMLQKLGVDCAPELLNIWTPIKLRNRLLSGAVRHPKWVLYDETHHHEAHSWQQLDLLTGLAPACGYTATPYRGTPRGTREFLEHWGDPLPIITYEEAIELGYIRMPTISILPLVDDDIVDVASGDFEVTSLEAATVDRLGDIAEHSRQWYSGAWDVPTIFSVPSVQSAARLQTELNSRGLPAVSVTAGTTGRQGIFDAVEASVLALIHVDVVSEGVDLRLRRYVDLSPTLSPVKWAQRIGRIMRPWDRDPEYICTNRNVLRHSYILEGVVPSSAVAETEAKFGPTKRAHSRVLGLEAIGRFKPASLECHDGCRLYVYTLSAVVNNVVLEFCCLVHPVKEPIWAMKVNTVKDGQKHWGNWVRCEPPTDLRGFASAGGREPSPNQQRWWDKSAKSRGLVRDQKVDRKSFVALPVLFDIGERM